MSFLSIAFLAALPLVATPILLHLFDRRRSVVIEWGAMQFLLEAATRKTRARRFQHWFLLLLRMAALAALVLALARPLAPTAWFGGNDRRETILLLDNSLSTQQRSGETTVFAELIARAEETIRGLEPGGTVRVLLSAPYPAWVTPASLRVDLGTRDGLVDLLHTLRPTDGTGDLPGALLKAIQSDLDDDRLAGRKVIVLNDGQRQDWRTEDVAGWTRFREVFENAKIPTSIEVVEADGSRAEAANVAITGLRSNRLTVGVNQQFSITAEVHNYSGDASRPSSVTWFVGSEQQAVHPIPALSSGETHDLVFRHSLGKQGVYSLTCRLDPCDVLPADDRESIVMEVVERVPVLLVEGSDGFAELQQDAYLVRAALGRFDGEEQGNWRAVFEPRTVSPQQLESTRLEEFQAIVIPNLAELSEKIGQRLTEYVMNGGGLWLALGPRTDPDVFNKLFYNSGDGLSPVGITRIVDESTDPLLQPTINPFLRTHPATADLADNEQLDTGDVRVHRRFRMQMPEAEGRVTKLLDLSNGEPLAVENRVGNGRVIVQAMPLRYQWSDLAVSHAFVVMVHDWLGYLTEPGGTRHNLLPGDPISLQVAGNEYTQATLTTPEGEDIAIAGEPTVDGVSFRTSRTVLPGNYSLDIGLAGLALPFHVAREPGESELARLTGSERRFLKESAGLNAGSLASQITGTNIRSPVWPALLVILILAMASELVLSGVIARKRFGAAPISDSAASMTGQPAISVGMSLGQRRRPEATTSRPEPEEAGV